MDESAVRAHFYRVLEVSPGASREEIKAAYKKQVAKWHTDRLEHNEELRKIAHERLIEINEAFECLTDPDKMRKYMIKMARTGRKPGQEAGTGAQDNGKTKQEEEERKRKQEEERHQRQAEQAARRAAEEQRRKQDSAARDAAREQTERQEREKALVRIQEAARLAAQLAAKDESQRFPPPLPTDFYNVVYPAAVAAAKKVADEAIQEVQRRNLDVSVQLFKSLYADAQQAGYEAATAELEKFKQDLQAKRKEALQQVLLVALQILNALATLLKQAANQAKKKAPALTSLFKDKQEAKIFAIVAAAVVILANFDKAEAWLKELNKPEPARPPVTEPKHDGRGDTTTGGGTATREGYFTDITKSNKPITSDLLRDLNKNRSPYGAGTGTTTDSLSDILKKRSDLGDFLSEPNKASSSFKGLAGTTPGATGDRLTDFLNKKSPASDLLSPTHESLTDILKGKYALNGLLRDTTRTTAPLPITGTTGDYLSDITRRKLSLSDLASSASKPTSAYEALTRTLGDTLKVSYTDPDFEKTLGALPLSRYSNVYIDGAPPGSLVKTGRGLLGNYFYVQDGQQQSAKFYYPLTLKKVVLNGTPYNLSARDYPSWFQTRLDQLK